MSDVFRFRTPSDDISIIALPRNTNTNNSLPKDGDIIKSEILEAVFLKRKNWYIAHTVIHATIDRHKNK